MGDAVAVVAATSEQAAREALRRIHVRYEPLPAVTDVEHALERGAPRIGGTRNAIVQFVEARGDVDAGFGTADAVIEGVYRCAPTDHGAIELEGGTGWTENGRVLLDVPCQTPFTVRRGVARAPSASI
jgi:CO/xanthine dehydrogenase Mo-binding subunit